MVKFKIGDVVRVTLAQNHVSYAADPQVRKGRVGTVQDSSPLPWIIWEPGVRSVVRQEDIELAPAPAAHSAATKQVVTDALRAVAKRLKLPG